MAVGCKEHRDIFLLKHDSLEKGRREEEVWLCRRRELQVSGLFYLTLMTPRPQICHCQQLYPSELWRSQEGDKVGTGTGAAASLGLRTDPQTEPGIS